MAAGRLSRRLQFSAPKRVKDGKGNTTDGFDPQFECAASVSFLRGGEQVLASRLEQVSPVVVTVRVSNNTRQITGDWRAEDVRTGVIYMVKESPRHPMRKDGGEDRLMFEFLATSGVAG
jgi:head-tail adaptor